MPVHHQHQLFQITLFIPTIAPNTQDVDIAAINGYFKGKFTPNMAGSVTPNIPEIQDVNAKPSSLTILRRL